MKIHLILTIAGLAISFALPTFAQEKDAAVDPQIVQQLHAIGKKSDEAFLKGDAAALAALYTEDAYRYRWQCCLGKRRMEWYVFPSRRGLWPSSSQGLFCID